jgi:uncharacterized protein (TIGR03118 family)
VQTHNPARERARMPLTRLPRKGTAMPSRLPARLACLALLVAAVAVVAGRASAAGNAYTVHNLVSNGAVPADLVDPSLVNGWGISASTTSPWWVSDNGTGVSTLYSGTGSKLALTVTVGNDPTGTVFNGTTGFVVKSADGTKSGPARFLFAGEAGTILGWNPAVAATTAVVGADRSSVGAVYKGLAIMGNRIYATDFHNGRVDMFDDSFQLVSAPGAFRDRSIKKGYAPFGVQAIGDRIYVTFAKQDKARRADVAGRGAGYVDAFDANGALVARVGKRTPHGPLNAPWGLALAPSSFGSFGGDVLVGNFGDGKISAFAAVGSRFVYKGQLRDPSGKLIAIDGLWGLGFGNGASSGPTDTLYFSAGPNDEKAGLFGSIRAAG